MEVDPLKPTPTEERIVKLLAGRPVQPRTAWAEALFREALVYLREGARAYDASAYLAACAMARASLESIFTVFEYRERIGGVWKVSFPEKNKRGRLLYPTFDALAERVSDEVRFPEDLRKAIIQIREDGDLSVHAAQKHDARLLGAVEAQTSGEIAPKWTKSWPTREEAETNLIRAAEILNVILRTLGI